jgi:hypothetical protein
MIEPSNRDKENCKKEKVTEEEEDSGCENEIRTPEPYNFVDAMGPHVIRGLQLGVLVREGLQGEHC